MNEEEIVSNNAQSYIEITKSDLKELIIISNFMKSFLF